MLGGDGWRREEEEEEEYKLNYCKHATELE